MTLCANTIVSLHQHNTSQTLKPFKERGGEQRDEKGEIEEKKKKEEKKIKMKGMIKSERHVI